MTTTGRGRKPIALPVILPQRETLADLGGVPVPPQGALDCSHRQASGACELPRWSRDIVAHLPVTSNHPDPEKRQQINRGREIAEEIISAGGPTGMNKDTGQCEATGSSGCNHWGPKLR